MLDAMTMLDVLHQPGNRPKEAKSTWIAVDMLCLVSFVHCTEAKTHCTVSNHDPIQHTMRGQSKIPCSKL